MNPLIQLKQTTSVFLVAFGLACFGLSSAAQAVSPAPDGGYPGGNTAEGQTALLSLTTGGFNTAVGWFSLKSLTTGSFNTGVGAGTLVLNSGDENTATGVGALLLNTTGGSNTANGAFALFNNTTGLATAIGKGALFSNTTGTHNTANGLNALFSNTTGNFNTANGDGALYGNTTGSQNTANGYFALVSNTTGTHNTANGTDALENNTGENNTADGADALLNNTTGFNNTATGVEALFSNTTGNFNVAFGAGAGASATTGSNNVYIGTGMNGVAGESNACYIASIFGQTSLGGTQVFINPNNQLGTLTSSKRFKEDIKPIDKVSEALFSLKPVSFRYKKEIDPAGRPQLGLVAEEVEKVNPYLVVRDKEGKPYSVRYDQVNAMLLNEFLKEHRKVEELEANATRQQKQIEALTTGLEKVSARLEAGKPAPHVVNNP